ncbi:hypothetical protein HK101_002177 [Irineochytrium annulatum]|nr:hypothetical protein HK101_002177 [Irineochytrium annulatum]
MPNAWNHGMDKLYGKLTGPKLAEGEGARPALPLPIEDKLKDGTRVVVTAVTGEESEEQMAFMQELLNVELRAGNTYPFEDVMDRPAFLAYFLSHNAFKVTTAADPTKILGIFYIKPNFPGRANHVCNGGFLTSADQRGRGVGMVMGRAYMILAPLCGFRLSLFNLVFANNKASAQIWKNLGFTEMGPLPGAARIKKEGGGEEFVDVYMYYYDFVNAAKK